MEKLLLISLVLFLVMALTGAAFRAILPKLRWDVLLAGFVLDVVSYEVLYLVLGILCRVTLRVLTVVYIAALGVWIATGLCVWIVRQRKSRETGTWKRFGTIERVLLFVVMVALISAYCYVVLTNQQLYHDDAYFMAWSETVLHNCDDRNVLDIDPYTGYRGGLGVNKKYLIAGQHYFIASMALVFGVSVASFARFSMALVLLLMQFYAVWRFAVDVFGKRTGKAEGDDVSVALAAEIVFVVLSFVRTMGYAEVSAAGWQYVLPWCGKAIVSNIGIVLLWYGLVRTVFDRSMWLFVALSAVTMCWGSSFGAILGVIAIAVISTFLAVMKRNVRLLFAGGLAMVPSLLLAFIVKVIVW